MPDENPVLFATNQAELLAAVNAAPRAIIIRGAPQGSEFDIPATRAIVAVFGVVKVRATNVRVLQLFDKAEAEVHGDNMHAVMLFDLARAVCHGRCMVTASGDAWVETLDPRGHVLTLDRATHKAPAEAPGAH